MSMESSVKTLLVEPIGLEQLEVTNHPLQSRLWGEVKKYNGWQPFAFKLTRGVATQTLLVLVKRIVFSCSLAYLPFAPSLDFYEPELATLLQGHLPKGLFCIRFDLPWGEIDQQSDVTILPESIQPEGSVLLDLKKPLEYRKRALRHIARSQKARVTIEEWGGSAGEFDQWYELYRESARRDHFKARSKGYLQQFFNASDQECRAHLYLARYRQAIVAGIIVLESAKHSLYLFGASKRLAKLSPSYQLQDYAIRRARERGAHTYDLYGISAQDNRGEHLRDLNLFKRSFGGEVVYRHPSFDAVFRPLIYKIYYLSERWRLKRTRQLL